MFIMSKEFPSNPVPAKSIIRSHPGEPFNGKVPDSAPDEETQTTLSPVPDGGFMAWFQCAGSFSLFLCTWGIVSSFGVFQKYYETAFPEQSSADISWIGSIQAFLLMVLGLLSGPLYDYGHLRALVLTGSTLSVLGIMLTSLCKEYWQVLLSQGFLLGIGSGCLFAPSVALLPTYFDKKQPLVMGIAASGSALGGIIFPILFEQLQPKIGFAWTMRVIGFIALAGLILPVLGMRMRTSPTEARKLFDKAALKEPAFLIANVYLLLVFLGAYIPNFYIEVLGIKEKAVSNSLAGYLIPLLNAGSFFGRIIPGYIADHVGAFNVDSVCVLTSTILAFAWVAVHSNAGIIVFILLWGFCSGAITSLSPNIAVALSPEPGTLGVRLGMLLIPVGSGLLLGNPIAGAIFAKSSVGLQLFTGALLAASFISILLLRIVMFGMSWRKKC